MALIIANNNSIIAMNNMTALRNKVIASRTKSEMMGMVKAQMIETLKAKMKNGIAHFIFQKKDGSLREAWGTIQGNIAKAKTNGRGSSRECYATCAFFDVENGGWRSFRWESLIQVF